MSGGMSFELSEDQELIRKSVAELCGRFDDHYWMEKDQPTSLGVLRRHRQGRLAGHDHPRGVRRARSGHHRGHPAARGGVAVRRGDERASAIHRPSSGCSRGGVTADELKAATRPGSSTAICTCASASPNPGAGLDTSRITTFAKRATTTGSTGARCGSPKALESEKILLLTRTTPLDEVTKTDGMTLFLTDLDRDHRRHPADQKMGRNAVSPTRCSSTT